MSNKGNNKRIAALSKVPPSPGDELPPFPQAHTVTESLVETPQSQAG